MPQDPLAALRAELDGAEPPPGLAQAVAPEHLDALAEAIASARARQQADLSTGIERALGFVPPGLRGSVKRIVFQDDS